MDRVELSTLKRDDSLTPQRLAEQYAVLLGRAYGESTETPEEKLYQIGGIKNAQTIIVAEQNKEPVGITAFNIFTPSTHHDFFRLLSDYPTIHRILQPMEIAVLPSKQGEGIGKLLWSKSIEMGKPDAIVGETRNPRSVLSLASGTGSYGFATAWAGELIYPTADVDMKIHDAVAHSYAESLFPIENKGYEGGVLPFQLFSNLASDQNLGMDPQTDKVMRRI